MSLYKGDRCDHRLSINKNTLLAIKHDGVKMILFAGFTHSRYAAHINHFAFHNHILVEIQRSSHDDAKHNLSEYLEAACKTIRICLLIYDPLFFCTLA